MTDEITMKPTDEISSDDVVRRYVVALDHSETTKFYVSPRTVCRDAVDASYLTRDDAETVAEQFADRNYTDARIVPVQVAGQFIVSVDGERTESGDEVLS